MPIKVYGERVLASQGTPYPVSQDEIDVLQDPTLYPRREPYLSLSAATRKLEEFLHQPRGPKEREALRRLRDLEYATGRFGRDIVFKVFNDIDTVFFAGKLYHNVLLTWGHCSTDDTIGETWPPSPPHRRVRIVLDYRLLTKPTSRLREGWSTLIHEMVHAFHLVKCTDCLESDDPDPTHGRHFVRCLGAVRNSLRGESFIKLSPDHDLCGSDSGCKFGLRPVGKRHAGRGYDGHHWKHY